MSSGHALEACNHTELYQLCQRVELKPSPGQTREELIAMLTGELDYNEPHPIDPWRHGLAGFVLDHWKTLQNQITCPLQSKDPRSCFGCLDTQVIACVSSNPDNEVQIIKHRKNES
jgi:hypothetical protein